MTTVGHQKGAGHGLISEEAAGDLERTLQNEIRAATPGQLAADWDLLNLLLTSSHWEGNQPVLALPTEPRLNAKILSSSRSEVRRQAWGNRAVRRAPRLNWDALTKVYGGDEQVREAVESVRPMADSDERLAETIELADRYLTGWRPDKFDD